MDTLLLVRVSGCGESRPREVEAMGEGSLSSESMRAQYARMICNISLWPGVEEQSAERGGVAARFRRASTIRTIAEAPRLKVRVGTWLGLGLGLGCESGCEGLSGDDGAAGSLRG